MVPISPDPEHWHALAYRRPASAERAPQSQA
jgi:hypothetical protein